MRIHRPDDHRAARSVLALVTLFGWAIAAQAKPPVTPTQATHHVVLKGRWTIDLASFSPDQPAIDEAKALAAAWTRALKPFERCEAVESEDGQMKAATKRCAPLYRKPKHPFALLVHKSGKRAVVDDVMYDNCCARHHLTFYSVPDGRVIATALYEELETEEPGLAGLIRGVLVSAGYTTAARPGALKKGERKRVVRALREVGSAVFDEGETEPGPYWLAEGAGARIVMIKDLWRHPLEGPVRMQRPCFLPARGEAACGAIPTEFGLFGWSHYGERLRDAR